MGIVISGNDARIFLMRSKPFISGIYVHRSLVAFCYAVGAGSLHGSLQVRHLTGKAQDLVVILTYLSQKIHGQTDMSIITKARMIEDYPDVFFRSSFLAALSSLAARSAMIP